MTSAVPTIRTLSPRPRRAFLTPARLGLYAFLVSAALCFLLPLYVMGITSIKPMSEIREGNIFAFPLEVTFAPWAQAWSSACTPIWPMAQRDCSSCVLDIARPSNGREQERSSCCLG